MTSTTPRTERNPPVVVTIAVVVTHRCRHPSLSLSPIAVIITITVVVTHRCHRHPSLSSSPIAVVVTHRCRHPSLPSSPIAVVVTHRVAPLSLGPQPGSRFLHSSGDNEEDFTEALGEEIPQENPVGWG